MLLKIRTIKIIFLLAFCTLSIFAQETIPAGGGNASGSGGSVSYTIGQVVYTKNTGTTGSVTQGIQQPFEISVVTGIEDIAGTSMSLSVYPNPAYNFLILKIEGYEITKLTWQLFDLDGKLLEFKNVVNSETSIDMSNHIPACYFLKVIKDNEELRTFKIIKY
jgi:hypothetical protein